MRFDRRAKVRRAKVRRPADRCFVPLAMVAVLAAGCGGGGDDNSASVTAPTEGVSGASVELVEALRSNGLTSLASAVESLDIDELADDATFTFFAPNDEAFQTLDAEEIADLLSDPVALTGALRNHLLTTRLTAADLAVNDPDANDPDGGEAFESPTGTDLTVTVDGDSMAIGDATIVQADLIVGNGVVHVIDRILVP